MSSNDETLNRLRSARGHLDAVIRMVEDDRYCIDVLHQIRAVQGALDRSRRALLDEAAALLRERRTALAASLEQHRVAYAAAVAKGVPLQYLLELDRERALIAGDLEWFESVIPRLEAGDIPWGSVAPTERYLEQRKAARQ